MQDMINPNFRKLSPSYLFSEVAARVSAWQEQHPDAKLVRMGIGDVTRPLPAFVTGAMQRASAELADAATFRGYGPEQGYAFLREAVARHYATFGVRADPDDIFISDGAKSDVGNITDLFNPGCEVLITDPVYPAYVDSSTMAGMKICYLHCGKDRGFLPPLPDSGHRSLIYLCSPNNPTGATLDRGQLQAWVDYAGRTGSIILYDAAYECFIPEGDREHPHSIFEIEGAETCAIEFASFSKSAGFTGVRCGYTVVPKALIRDGLSLRDLWFRRQSTRFNGCSYITQRGAEAAFSPEGLRGIRANIDYYRENAAAIMKTLDALGIYYTGGRTSPYLWMECPGGADSWDFFDTLLNRAAVVGTPGAGFGESGKNFFRLTAFSTHEATAEAMRRLQVLVQGGTPEWK